MVVLNRKCFVSTIVHVVILIIHFQVYKADKPFRESDFAQVPTSIFSMEHILQTLSHASPVECAMLCMEHDPCLLFLWDDVYKNCTIGSKLTMEVNNETSNATQLLYVRIQPKNITCPLDQGFEMFSEFDGNKCVRIFATKVSYQMASLTCFILGGQLFVGDVDNGHWHLGSAFCQAKNMTEFIYVNHLGVDAVCPRLIADSGSWSMKNDKTGCDTPRPFLCEI